MWLTGLVAPQHVGSSRTRARTRVPCIGTQRTEIERNQSSRAQTNHVTSDKLLELWGFWFSPGCKVCKEVGIKQRPRPQPSPVYERQATHRGQTRPALCSQFLPIVHVVAGGELSDPRHFLAEGADSLCPDAECVLLCSALAKWLLEHP